MCLHVDGGFEVVVDIYTTKLQTVAQLLLRAQDRQVMMLSYRFEAEVPI